MQQGEEDAGDLYVVTSHDQRIRCSEVRNEESENERWRT